MNIYLNEQAYNLVRDRGVCAPASIVEALNAGSGETYRLARPSVSRKRAGQIVRLDLSGDGIDRLKLAASTATPQPLTVSDYVSKAVEDYYGGEK